MIESPLPQLARVEAARHALYGAAGHVLRQGPLVAVHAGPGLPVNGAWHAGDGPPGEADFAALEAFSTGHGQAATLHVLSHVEPDVLTLLATRGYALTGVLHVYVRSLGDLPPPPTLDVQEGADVNPWVTLAAGAFGPGNERIARLTAALPGTHRLLALVNGTPAGVAALSVQGGVAAFYSAATLPQWRGWGVQSALLGARLHLAARLGAELASAFVRPESGSERNVRRAGFTGVGARLTFTRR